ncbi:MAG: DUF3857 domain-containing protein [Ferruginibacter sp.]
MKFLVYTVLSFFPINNLFAQKVNILIPAIPAILKENAHAVLLENREEFEIKSISKASYKVHQLITVLDEQGKEYLSFWGYADKFHMLDEVDIRLYDGQGKMQKQFNKKDLISFYAGDGLITDTKLYYAKFSTNNYPVTVQVDYEIKYNGILQFPAFDIQQPSLSVVSSSYTCIVAANMDLRYMSKNISLEPVITTEKNNKIYTWSVTQLPAFKYEESTVSAESSYPKILLAPNRFELDGYEGDMTSWEKFGEWYYALAKNASNLPESKKHVLREMVKDAPTEKEKAKIIYQYLQKNFRYVSIQLGIGGFKPFEASFVDQKKYGDCKALSNYAQACLEAVGIKSYQALINAEYNKEPVDPNFPINGFNHVILCVPLKGDTTWLECTSNTNEFAVLGNFTENRNALLITEHGGKLVRTPPSKSKDNQLSTHTIVTLASSGAGEIKIDLAPTGEYRSFTIAKDTKDDQKKYLVNALGYIAPDNFSLTENIDNNSLSMDFQQDKIPDFVAGKKMFLNPRMYKLWKMALPAPGTRTKDFYFPFPFIKSDTTEYKLPQGYTMEALPPNKNFSNKFSEFQSSYRYDKAYNKIICLARFELKNYLIPVAGYKETAQFFSDVIAEYAEKIIIKQE